MIIYDLHIVEFAILEPKADSPLLIDSDAVLPLSIAFQRL